MTESHASGSRQDARSVVQQRLSPDRPKERHRPECLSRTESPAQGHVVGASAGSHSRFGDMSYAASRQLSVRRCRWRCGTATCLAKIIVQPHYGSHLSDARAPSSQQWPPGRLRRPVSPKSPSPDTATPGDASLRLPATMPLTRWRRQQPNLACRVDGCGNGSARRGGLCSSFSLHEGVPQIPQAALVPPAFDACATSFGSRTQ